MITRTDQELETIYREGHHNSVAHALRAVYQAGRADESNTAKEAQAPSTGEVINAATDPALYNRQPLSLAADPLSESAALDTGTGEAGIDATPKRPIKGAPTPAATKTTGGVTADPAPIPATAQSGAPGSASAPQPPTASPAPNAPPIAG